MLAAPVRGPGRDGAGRARRVRPRWSSRPARPPSACTRARARPRASCVDDLDRGRARHARRASRRRTSPPSRRTAPRASLVADGPADDRVQPATLGPAGDRRRAGGPDQRLGGLALGAGRPAGARAVTSCPRRPPYDSRAEVPQPDGLVGRHRSRRLGSGTEFEGIRPFATGDRLKRITWPVSLRTGELHVITTRAEQDAGVWLVVDGLRRHRRLGRHRRRGQQPRPHRPCRGGARRAPRPHRRPGGHAGRGRRRCAGAPGLRAAPPPAAPGHPRPGPHRGAQRRARAARPRGERGQRRLRAVADALHPARHRGREPPAQRRVGGRHRHDRDATASLRRRRPARAAVAWRPGCRRSSATTGSQRLAALGCPVVPWRGPGTLDTVLHQLARRARAPKVRGRDAPTRRPGQVAPPWP